MVLRIIQAEVCGSYELRLQFNNGQTRIAQLKNELFGPIFEPLRDATYFDRVTLDPICGTVVWPNGADFAPEALWNLSKAAETAQP